MNAQPQAYSPQFYIGAVDAEIARRRKTETFTRDFEFRGGNLDFLDDDSHEAILAGPSETGKTVAALVKASRLLESAPNVQGLVIRKVRRDMRVNVLRTFETKVLKQDPKSPDSPIIAYGGRSPQEYIYPNGSSLYVAGMDDPGKALGSEWDFIYVNQPEELALEDWETLVTRCTGRAGNLDNPQIFGDPNPALDRHWILQRAADGPLALYKSRHEDNPFLFDIDKNEWTQQGEITRRILSQLTGARRLRLFEGIWGQLEGLVYPEFDRHTHVVNFDQLVEWGVVEKERQAVQWQVGDKTETFNLPVFTQNVRTRIGALDWGYTHAGVLAVGGLDGDGRCYIICQAYCTRQIIDWWVARAAEMRDAFGIRKFVADPSDPGNIEKMKRANVRPRLRVQKANNAVKPGIDSVKARLNVQEDGRARLYFLDEGLVFQDDLRKHDHKPIRIEDEFDSYQWNEEKEQPIKADDDGVDAIRYLIAAADEAGGVGFSR